VVLICQNVFSGHNDVKHLALIIDGLVTSTLLARTVTPVMYKALTPAV